MFLERRACWRSAHFERCCPALMFCICTRWRRIPAPQVTTAGFARAQMAAASRPVVMAASHACAYAFGEKAADPLHRVLNQAMMMRIGADYDRAGAG
jgi:hypothetical protein